MNARDAEKQSAVEDLLGLLKPGDTVYTQLKHVSRSGMAFVIQLVLIRNNEPRWIGFTAARALGMRYDRDREGIKVTGCGMDMGFHLVYELSATLFGGKRGYACLGNGPNRCPSSFHQGEHYKDFTTQPIHHDGYALAHRWL